MHDRPEGPYEETLSVTTFMCLLVDYTQAILSTNALGAEIALEDGCSWEHTFAFGLPKEMLLVEVNRMAVWCQRFRAEVQAAQLKDLLSQENSPS